MPEMDQKKQNLLRVYTRMTIKESIVQNFCLNNLKPDELCGTIGYSYVKGVCTMIFDQFTPQMLDFLAENHIRNSKPWYEEHKELCRTLAIEPFYQLTELMAPTMLEIDPQLVVIPYKALSRVRRDNRFTKNKDLYRDHLWLTFRHPKKHLSDSLCYYFEVEQEGWGYGIGYYAIPSNIREEYRQMILNHDIHYLAARKALAETPDFTMYGDCYKRPPYPDAPEEDQLWLNRKNIGVSFFSEDHTALFDGTFYDIMIDNIKRIAPFYYFLRTAEERVRRQ